MLVTFLVISGSCCPYNMSIRSSFLDIEASLKDGQVFEPDSDKQSSAMADGVGIRNRRYM